MFNPLFVLIKIVYGLQVAIGFFVNIVLNIHDFNLIYKSWNAGKYKNAFLSNIQVIRLKEVK